MEELLIAITSLKARLEEVEKLAIPIYKNCTKCDHWNMAKDTCGLWQTRPPGYVIVVGCDDFSDVVPF